MTTINSPRALRAGRLVSTIAMLAVLVTACTGGSSGPGSSPTTTPGGGTTSPAPTETGGEAPELDAEWDRDAPAAWEELLTAARAEGEVTVAGFAPLAGPMAAAFEADTGIRVNWVSAMGGELVARAMQEAASGQITIDLAMGSGVTIAMYEAGNLQPIRPEFILPSVTDPAAWRDGELLFFDDADEYIFQPTEYLHGWAMVNTDEVDISAIDEWTDLLDPQYQGLIATHNPTAPGPGEAVAAFLWRHFGEDFLNDLYVGQEVAIAPDTSQLAEWVARGEYPIALGGVQQDFERFRQEGFNIEPVLPGYRTGGFSVVAFFDGAPNPNAAKVFLNWLASPAGQAVYQGVTMETSRRTDVSKDDLPSYVDPEQYPDTGFNGYDWHYYTVERPPIIAGLTEALGGR